MYIDKRKKVNIRTPFFLESPIRVKENESIRLLQPVPWVQPTAGDGPSDTNVALGILFMTAFTILWVYLSWWTNMDA